MKPIKNYYRIKFKLISPLSIGSGENDMTDQDILLDGRGIPYIPGTALAGVYRGLFDDETAKQYFGSLLTEERTEKKTPPLTEEKEKKPSLTESDIIVYDAVLLNGESHSIAVRDMVALDEYKISAPGAKFDFQVLEPGVQFVTYLEQNMAGQTDDVLAEIAKAWQQGEICLGAKTARGYGSTEAVEIVQCRFNLEEKDERDRWLEFDLYEDAEWEAYSENFKPHEIKRKQKKQLEVLLSLKQCGGISVRQYSTDVKGADYKQMVRNGNVPVIPGTSWAGAFRAQFEKLDPAFQRDAFLTELFFGKKASEDDNKGWKSRVSFSESKLSKGRWETYTRNAIDRFSGGTIDGALYMEEAYFDGRTDLCISCDLTGLQREAIGHFGAVLSAAILDLDRGFLSIGGVTAAGHGLFQVEEIVIDGRKLNFSGTEPKAQYAALKGMICGGGQE